MADVSKIGSSIRSLRKSQNITLQNLAEKTGLSVGYLSNLERNVSSPTLLNMQKICTVLNKSLGDLLERSSEEKIVIRKKDREITMDDKSSIYLETIDFGNEDLSFLLMKVLPGAEDLGMWWTHDYDEVGTVLSGELTIAFEDKVFDLQEGDTIQIQAHTKHSYRSNSKDTESISYWCKHWKNISE